MAKLYFKNKDYKMAEKSFNEYLNMNPEDVAALKLLAQVYEQNKRFDKAFEMYERCYLAEPDRTGVLLDICRILLMNEIWLEHVDYRKWLNLAIKAFPSNPIVVNFKAFLSTLPPEEQSSPKHEATTPPATKAQGTGTLTKILDKLTMIEKRLDTIEEQIGKLSVTRIVTQPSEAKLTPIPDPVPEPKPPSVESSPLSLTKPVDSTPEKKLGDQINIGQSLFNMSKLNLSTSQNPWSNTTNTSLNFFKPVEKDNTSKNNLSFSPSIAKDSPSHKESIPDKKTESPFNLSTNLFSESLKNLSMPIVPPAPVSTSSFSFSTNLFADSIKKFNIPVESSWSNKSTTVFGELKPREEENEPEENEDVVQNEELVIENTCDMTPIEIKSGEEDEDILFEHRCKLFRFRDKEYKERGLGSIKVLKHKTTGKGRLIMRRDAIGLVCLNCWDCSKVERVRDTQVRWIGIDASDGEVEPTVFLAKFKTQELTDQFMSHLTALFSEASPNTSISTPKSETDKPETTTSSGPEKPDVELIDPKLDQSLVDKARKLQLPDLFYHKLKNLEPCEGCNGCEKDE